ncbi:MAG: alpha-amylase family glycosyl hydrolase, partial [Erysipelotrichaceae bacterium]|nr:alpha-amylase family glycosyl hydrolase [Erysipelotrichaceae bacterium]
TDGRIVSALRSKNGHVLSQYLADYYNAIKNMNAEAISSIFLSNHDQGRSAAFFLDEQQRKLAASIYLLAPAIPFVYYGEEIGMLGSGRDENKRLAMVWGEGKDTKSPKDADYAGEFNSSVKEQLKDKNSLLNHYKKVIHLRNQYLDIQNVKIQVYLFKNKHLCAIEYIYGNKTVMVVHNLSGETIVDELAGYRIVDQVVLSEKATIQQDQLTIAPYSTVILNK